MMKYKKNLKSAWLVLAVLLLSLLTITNCSTNKKAVTEAWDKIYTNQEVDGFDVEFSFLKGEEHNHPLMAVWIEDMDGNYLQTIYVAESIAKGVFGHGDKSQGKWLPGPIRRPAALPYWGHQRNIKAQDGYYIPSQKSPLPDAVTGATPKANSSVFSKVESSTPQKFKVLFEINQTWDWNEHWTNNKFPDDENYKTSCQPSLIYAAEVDQKSDEKTYKLLPIGHGHYSGKDGSLNKDLSTLTTALHIVENVTFVIKN